MTTTSLLDDPAHRARLDRGFTQLLDFALPSIAPGGGFHHLGADRRPLPGRRPRLFLTARMAWVASAGVRQGIPAATPLLDHAMDSLLGLHWDPVHGGWHGEPGTPGRKAAYDHVHVAMAAAGALAAAHPDAAELLARAVDLIDTRLWDDASGTVHESFAADWSDPEDYRGANANMHATEAMILLGAATGERRWHERAYAVARRLIDGTARAHGWLLPEHYTAHWEPMLGHHRERPDDPFRPYGATLGHSLEWARFLLQLDRSPWVGGQPWLPEAAAALAARALDDGWGIDGIEGLPYTVDWDGRVVSGLRLHWPVCEAIQASAELVRATGDGHWERWYRRLWRHAEDVWIDDRGAWITEVDASLAEAGTRWPGRSDVYHAAGALRAARSAGNQPLG